MTPPDRSGNHARVPRPTNTRVSAVVLELVLWAVTGLVLAINVARPLARDALLGIGRGPYWGLAPSVTANVSDPAWQREIEALSRRAWPDWPGWMVGGPFPRGEYIEAVLTNQAVISVWSPMTFRQMVGVAGAEHLSGLVMAAALVLGILIVRDLRHGRLFTTRNLKRVYTIAIVLGVGGMLAEAAGVWGRIGILTSPPIAGYVDVDWTMSLTPLILGLTFAAGAEVLRIGMRMQHDVEGLV